MSEDCHISGDERLAAVLKRPEAPLQFTVEARELAKAQAQQLRERTIAEDALAHGITLGRYHSSTTHSKEIRMYMEGIFIKKFGDKDEQC